MAYEYDLSSIPNGVTQSKTRPTIREEGETKSEAAK
ncbi:uncharacterized protein G2W53_024843 [Senna tora]|uniref:Uncharacterized protein n=1 Tax=Senna tora TaxID=362788 RepID=A0A834TBY9_9FABA|nr:uncharacterized protein G2W53_024843 [Senna tora]